MISTTAPRKAMLAVLTAATATGLALAATPAQAAGVAKKCGNGPANCVLTKTHPRKGTVRVTVNNYGGGKSYLYGWDIRHAGKIVCTGEVREAWKAKTFTCKNMPKGKLRLTVSYEKNTSAAMKW
ncbi:hypothetical protein ABZ499_21480 [Streptomyces sp. NPDC019990]|uniref:hypothetical protein n=1 Tax=Streptomyces sp. NPDC019990 TaxID=3154693 RepID=UPI0033E223A7